MAVQQTFEFLAEPSRLPSAGRGVVRVKDDAGGRDSVRATEEIKDPTPVRTEPNPSAGGSAGASNSQIDQLRAQVGCITSAARPTDDKQQLSTGSNAINRLLPAGGLRVDAVTEWVAEADGSGAAALSLITAANRLQQIAGPLVVVCPPDYFYPPAVVALGIPAARIIWVRPTRHADTVWSIDQALRCSATAVVWAPIAARLDDRDARRFQLAAEIGKTPGLLIRPATVRGRPTFADVRFHISNEASREGKALAASESNRVMRVTLDRCRGGQIGRSAIVQITDTANIQQVMTMASR